MQPLPQSFLALLLLQFQLPAFIQDEAVFQQWMQSLHHMIVLHVEPLADDDPSEWPNRPVWKAKKWACQILYKLFDRCVAMIRRFLDSFFP